MDVKLIIGDCASQYGPEPTMRLLMGNFSPERYWEATGRGPGRKVS